MNDLAVVKTTDNKYCWFCNICGETGKSQHDQYAHAEDWGKIHMYHNHGGDKPVFSFENKPNTVLMTNEQINDFVRRLRVASEKINTAPFYAHVDIEKICQEMQLLTIDPKYR